MAGGEVLDQIINRGVAWFEGLEREAGIKDHKEGKEVELNTGDAYEWAEKVLKGVDVSQATAQTIEDFMVALPRMFKDRIKFGEGHSISEKNYPAVGFYISALCAKIPLQRYLLPTHPLQTEMNFSINYLFYKFHPKNIPEVDIDGPVGDNCFHYAQLVAYVRGPAGYRNGRGFAKGLIKFLETAGNNTAEEITGGHVQLKSGGKNIGLKARGGVIEADAAGDNLGKLNDGASIFVYQSAGANMGEGMTMGTIQARCAPMSDAGKDMKGGRIKLFTPYTGTLPPTGKTGGIIETYDGLPF